MLSGETIFEQILSDTLHADTQVETSSVSLTAAAIEDVENSGELDFGGSEFQLADRRFIEPEKRDPDDDYGWWNLEGGQYLLELNESVQLGQDQKALLEPHEHLVWNGASHPTLTFDVDDSDSRIILPLSVPDGGIRIKENARVSSIRVSETG